MQLSPHVTKCASLSATSKIDSNDTAKKFTVGSFVYINSNKVLSSIIFED